MVEQSLLERLRPLVANESWDYIVLWKWSDDHGCLELMDCICGGTQSNGAAAFSVPPCRDVLFSHSRTKSCDMLDYVPSSIKLGSGIHAESLLSNHSSWLNFSYNSDSKEKLGTRVLVPVPLGLLELFVSREVPEDQHAIDLIKSQCNFFLQEQAMSNSGCTDSSGIPSHSFLSDANLQKALSMSQLQIAAGPCVKNSGLPHDRCIDRINLGTSPFSPLQQFSSTSGENGFHETETSQSTMTHNVSRLTKWMEPSRNLEDQMTNKILVMDENKKPDNPDPSNEEEDEGKYRKGTGKGHQSKNLEAERKRRKKLNDRLYSLRALVPNITKLDRTAILGDAIDYVKELQKQLKDLQIELEQHSDDETDVMMSRNGVDNSMPLVMLQHSGTTSCLEKEHKSLHKELSGNGCSNTPKQGHMVENTNTKVHQMEPQVEVYQMDGNEFYVKVFCEQKPGGFVRLMEALNSLGLQVINVNATRHTCLVSNILILEKKESETIEPHYLKEFLLELARNPLRACSNRAKASLSYI